MLIRRALTTLLLLSGASALHAAPSDARLYRYYDNSHRPNVTDTVTLEHIIHGYEELNSNMQVLRKIPAQRLLTAEEQAAAKVKRETDAQRRRDDQQLQRLYASAADAETARDRQLESIQVRLDFSNNALQGLRQRRAEDAQKAANFERTGKPVPKTLRDSIAASDHEIKSTLITIDERKAEQEKVKQTFATIIERLTFLADQKEKAGAPSPSKP